MKYRKKPIVIEAMQLPATDCDPSNELIDWLHTFDADWCSSSDGSIEITTLEGVMTAQPEDWIIKGVKGEMYPCKPDIFEATYEVANDV